MSSWHQDTRKPEHSPRTFQFLFPLPSASCSVGMYEDRQEDSRHDNPLCGNNYCDCWLLVCNSLKPFVNTTTHPQPPVTCNTGHVRSKLHKKQTSTLWSEGLLWASVNSNVKTAWRKVQNNKDDFKHRGELFDWETKWRFPEFHRFQGGGDERFLKRWKLKGAIIGFITPTSSYLLNRSLSVQKKYPA